MHTKRIEIDPSVNELNSILNKYDHHNRGQDDGLDHEQSSRMANLSSTTKVIKSKSELVELIRRNGSTFLIGGQEYELDLRSAGDAEEVQTLPLTKQIQSSHMNLTE